MWDPITRAMVVASHVLFLFPISVILFYRLWFHAVVWALVTIVSTMYHSCQVYPATCVVPYSDVGRWDMTFATTIAMLIFLEILYPMLSFPFYTEMLVVGLFYLLNVGCLAVRSFVPWIAYYVAQWVIVVGTTSLASIAVIVVYVRARKSAPKHRFRDTVSLPWYILGLLVTAAGAVFYFCCTIDGTYPVLHTLWHSCIGIGMGCVMIGIWPTATAPRLWGTGRGHSGA